MRHTAPRVEVGIQQILVDGPPRYPMGAPMQVATGEWLPTIRFLNPDDTPIYAWEGRHTYSDAHMAYENALTDAESDEAFAFPDMLDQFRSDIRLLVEGRLRFRGQPKSVRGAKS